MQKTFKITLVLTLAACFAACSTLKFPWAYKVTVVQGNYIEHEMVDQLKVGMTKRQVRYVMGSPLVEDTFNPDRWDYYYSVKRGDKILKEQHFTVYFENDQLTRWEGTYEPEKKSQVKPSEKEADSTEESANASDSAETNKKDTENEESQTN